jgi:hypothetical protein
MDAVPWETEQVQSIEVSGEVPAAPPELWQCIAALLCSACIMHRQ